MFPQELKELPNWCVWRLEERNGRSTKIPFNANTGFPARSNDPSTWADYETALWAWDNNPQNAGLGFFFTKPYIGVDLDDVGAELEDLENGFLEGNVVFEFFEGLKTYAEISPSGQGIHLIGKGEIPGDRNRKENIEIYQEGRFFTMTGNTLSDKYNEISEISTRLKPLYDKYIEPKVAVLPKRGAETFEKHELTDSEVIAQALASKQGERFRAFLSGKWEGFYSSQSEADLAFANLLAFWCARDFAQMDRIFRKSGMMRDKWDGIRGKTTYGESTLFKAINDASNVYTPKKEEPYYIFGGEFAEKKEKIPNFSWDDTGNGQRFVYHFGDSAKYVYNFKKFFLYNGKNWELDESGAIHLMINETIERIKDEELRIPESADEEEADDIRKKWNKFISSCRATNRKNNILQEIKPLISTTEDSFDEDDFLLNTQNGFVDLTSGEFHPHDREKLFSKIADYEHSETHTPETWLKFLDEIFDGDQETIDYIQKAVGYSLTGSTREQVMFVLLGGGRNGKSLFVNTIAEILGSYTKNIQASSLMAKHYDTVNNDIAQLQGARVVTATEPNKGFRFDEGLIKQLTGGDPISARFLYGEFFEYYPKFKLWLTTNYRPIINGVDDGIWRRIVLVPFDVQIPADKVDPDLKYKLLREASGILDWAVQGAIKWQEEGLTPSKKIRSANSSYRKEMDVLETFVDELCNVGQGYQYRASEFYQDYIKWAQSTRSYEMSNKEFGERMGKKFERAHSRVGRVYKGVGKREIYPGLNNM